MPEITVDELIGALKLLVQEGLPGKTPVLIQDSHSCRDSMEDLPFTAKHGGELVVILQ